MEVCYSNIEYIKIWRTSMKLISLLERLEYTCIQGSTDQEVEKRCI